MSDRWQQVGAFGHDLALAVRLTDGVAGGRPIGTPSVRVDGVDEVPPRNRSGYHLFFDLPPTSVTVRVDGGAYYRDASRTVDVDPSNPTYDPGTAEEFVLEPTPAYSFPSGLTRVRGQVRQSGQPVSDAEVSVQGLPGTVRTTDTGEFVYVFADIDHTDVDRDPNTGVRYVMPGNAHPVFAVTWPNGGFTQSVTVRPGRLTSANLTN